VSVDFENQLKLKILYSCFVWSVCCRP